MVVNSHTVKVRYQLIAMQRAKHKIALGYQPIIPEDCSEQHASEKWLPQGPKLFASDPVLPAWAWSDTPAWQKQGLQHYFALSEQRWVMVGAWN